MKKFLVLLALAVLSLSVASASPIDCIIAGTGSGGSVNSSTVITCGTLTFDDFSIPSATANGSTAFNPGVIDVTEASYDSVTGDVLLTFDPGLVVGSGATDFADDKFEFAVWGGVTEIDLAVGGAGSSIDEKVCSTAFAIPGVCTGTEYANIDVLSSTSPQPVCAPPSCTPGTATTSPVYVYKNIETYGPNGSLSEFTQSFDPVTVPEPVSMVLLGSGLLGLGLLRRRSRRS